MEKNVVYNDPSFLGGGLRWEKGPNFPGVILCEVAMTSLSCPNL